MYTSSVEYFVCVCVCVCVYRSIEICAISLDPLLATTVTPLHGFAFAKFQALIQIVGWGRSVDVRYWVSIFL